MNLHKFRTYVFVLLIAAGPTSAADPRVLLRDEELSFSRLLTNDYIGDHKDRWRTFSYGASVLKPLNDGGVAELRFRAEIIAGKKLKLAAGETPDRRMVGVWGLGIYHSNPVGSGDYRAGVELTFIGPQTRLVSLQKHAHELLGQHGPSARAQELQVPDDVLVSVSGEYGRNYEFDKAVWRLWTAASTGSETIARGGLDFTSGHAAGDFGVRDEVTGWRLPVYQARGKHGRSFVAGVDFSHIKDSNYIEKDGLIRNRVRLRAGALADFAGGRIFYGVTYLSEEFRKQDQPQVVGSVTLSISF
jgi:hypothetical protein